MAMTYCTTCQGIDESPKHLIDANAPGAYPPPGQGVIVAVLQNPALSVEDRASILADLHDTTSDRKHITCCAADGCPAAGTDTECRGNN